MEQPAWHTSNPLLLIVDLVKSDASRICPRVSHGGNIDNPAL